MTARREIPLCHYRYDPLDQLISCATAQINTQRFYLKDRLATEVQGAVQCSIMQHEEQLLAQQQHQTGTLETQLFATDRQRSVLNVLDINQYRTFSYTSYGHRPTENGLLSLLGFNGERPDPMSGHYLLGNGYRAFNPVLMRFNSPDNWSPFGSGGLNAYAYCMGDPMNRTDPTGHSVFELVKKAASKFFRPILHKRSMGAFQPFENMPDVMSTIIGNLKAADIASLGATSPTMFKIVNEAKLFITGSIKPTLLKNNNKLINKAWDIATGKMPGTTPNQLKTVGINDPYDIPHIVDDNGFASLQEIERRYRLREEAETVQRDIRSRLD